jgi:hypothetical protein
MLLKLLYATWILSSNIRYKSYEDAAITLPLTKGGPVEEEKFEVAEGAEVMSFSNPLEEFENDIVGTLLWGPCCEEEGE